MNVRFTLAGKVVHQDDYPNYPPIGYTISAPIQLPDKDDPRNKLAVIAGHLHRSGAVTCVVAALA